MIKLVPKKKQLLIDLTLTFYSIGVTLAQRLREVGTKKQPELSNSKGSHSFISSFISFFSPHSFISQQKT
jgi:hypothetical protein